MPESVAKRVLVVEDDPDLRDLLVRALPRQGFDVSGVDSSADALAHLDERGFDVVLTDVHLAGEDGLALCAAVRDAHPTIPVVVMTAFGTLELAVEAMRSGAWDFLTKPLDLGIARLALDRALEHRRLTLEVRQLRRRVRLAQGVGELVGESEPMRRLYAMIERVAGVGSSVLITGESGTGKELVARALHERSPRAKGPFVAINCAAMPESLLESELFGHVKGAFTDASSSRTGLFVQASGGTLFLDEIGDMPLGLQAKLLRALQERRVRPVGSEKELPIDVRVVSATHQDLDGAAREGRFREDLLYRLDVIRLELPPLRKRGGDVLLLAQRFVQQQAAGLGKEIHGFSPAAAALLLDHGWPGNVRELQNCIERAAVLAEHDRIEVADLPERVRRARPTLQTGASGALLPLEVVEKRHILAVLEAVGGSRSEAARILQIDRKTLYRKLDRWEQEERGG